MKKGSRHKKTTEYHHGNLNSACKKEAVKILAKKGPNELSLRDIARKLGVSHGAPYRHFKSREGLLAAIAAEGFLKFAAYLNPEETPSDIVSPEQLFASKGQAFVKFAFEYPVHFKLMFSKAIPDHEKYPELDQAAKGAFMLLYKMVEGMQAANVFKSFDPTITSIYIWSHLHGLCSLILDDRLKFLEIGPEATERMLESMHDMILLGLKKT